MMMYSAKSFQQRIVNITWIRNMRKNRFFETATWYDPFKSTCTVQETIVKYYNFSTFDNCWQILIFKDTRKQTGQEIRIEISFFYFLHCGPREGKIANVVKSVIFPPHNRRWNYNFHFPFLHTIFFLLWGRKMVLFAHRKRKKWTLWPASIGKVNLLKALSALRNAFLS